MTSRLDTAKSNLRKYNPLNWPSVAIHSTTMQVRAEHLIKKFFNGTSRDEMGVFAVTTLSTAVVSFHQVCTLPNDPRVQFALRANKFSVFCNGTLVAASVFEHFRRKAEAKEDTVQ